MPHNPVIDLAHSPHAILKPIPISSVKLTDSFLQPRREINRTVTLIAQLNQCEITGRIDNFRVASGRKQGEFQGIFFNDSDIYKWLEAAAFSLGVDPDPELDAKVDAVIDDIAAAQQPNGYLNTYYMFAREKDRFSNLKDMHEIYCAGHLIQAAVAHFRATGKRTLLDVACKLSDHLYDQFGPGKRLGTCGHEEAEMALVELYRATGEQRYLTLAHCMMEARGKTPGIFGNGRYHQDHLPFTEQKEMVGHAVRHLYYMCGGADVALEAQPAGYAEALETLWQNFTQRRMYVTGGAGARYEGESFGDDYELPNDRAYTETCAAIASVMWNWRMLHLTGESRFADMLELALYNAVLPGISLDGTHYFYENPLANRGEHRRQEWFGCACCPPNIARLLASLPGYFYSVSPNNVWIHLYAQGEAQIPLPNGETLHLDIETNYPWSGEVRITILKAPKTPITLNLRIPAWAGSGIVENAGKTQEATSGYVGVTQAWQAGDSLTLSLPLETKLIESHPHLQNNRGRVALQRGAIVYCLEQADHADVDVWEVAISPRTAWKSLYRPELLNGVVVLLGEGEALNTSGWENRLYRTYVAQKHEAPIKIALTAVPYYVWANREAGAMQVWLPLVED